MSSKVWSIGIQKHKNNDSASCSYQIHRSVQSGRVHEKNDRNEINSVDDHRVWLFIRVTSVLDDRKKFLDYLLTDLCSLNLKFC